MPDTDYYPCAWCGKTGHIGGCAASEKRDVTPLWVVHLHQLLDVVHTMLVTRDAPCPSKKATYARAYGPAYRTSIRKARDARRRR